MPSLRGEAAGADKFGNGNARPCTAFRSLLMAMQIKSKFTHGRVAWKRQRVLKSDMLVT